MVQIIGYILFTVLILFIAKSYLDKKGHPKAIKTKPFLGIGKLQNPLFPLCFGSKGGPEWAPKRAPKIVPNRAPIWAKMGP